MGTFRTKWMRDRDYDRQGFIIVGRNEKIKQVAILCWGGGKKYQVSKQQLDGLRKAVGLIRQVRLLKEMHKMAGEWMERNRDGY